MGWNILKKVKRALSLDPREHWKITTDSLRDIQDSPGAYASAVAAYFGAPYGLLGKAGSAGGGMDWWDAAKTVGGAGLDWYQANQAQEFSAQQAAAQMAFQERMSNTAFQRQMEDLRRAGLNPMLSSQLGGASTPGGAMGQPQRVRTAQVASDLMSAHSARQLQGAQAARETASAALETQRIDNLQAERRKLATENLGLLTRMLPEVDKIRQETQTGRSQSSALSSKRLLDIEHVVTQKMEQLLKGQEYQRGLRKTGAVELLDVPIAGTKRISEQLPGAVPRSVQSLINSAKSAGKSFQESKPWLRPRSR